MIDKLAIVLAHGGAKETVIRHLPHWQSIHDHIIICSPGDDPCWTGSEDYHVWHHVWGRSTRYHSETNRRTLNALKVALHLYPVTTTFYEYDALLWYWPGGHIRNAAAEGPAFVMGSKFKNADHRFIGPFYVHSPIIMTTPALQRTIMAMENMPIDAEFGFGDRYFGLAFHQAGLRVIDGHEHGLSYSQNHIQRQHWKEAVEKIKLGACFTHGIKDAETFKTLRSAVPVG